MNTSMTNEFYFCARHARTAGNVLMQESLYAQPSLFIHPIPTNNYQRYQIKKFFRDYISYGLYF